MIDLTIDDNTTKALQKAFKRAPELAFKNLRQGFFQIQEGFITQWERDKLRGRPGLIVRSGKAGLKGAAFTEIKGGDTEKLEVNSFIGGNAVKYAEIQEFGTVGAGGTMPDIVPVKAKWLTFQVDGQWVRTKRVAIPPRMGWLKTWDAREDKREKQYRKTLTKIVEGLAKK